VHQRRKLKIKSSKIVGMRYFVREIIKRVGTDTVETALLMPGQQELKISK
jgi:hypothetical protein